MLTFLCGQPEAFPSILVIRNAIPPVLAVIVAGIFASVVAPRLQRHYIISSRRVDRKIELAESSIEQFATYINALRRLITISLAEKNGKFTAVEEERKQTYVKARDSAKDKLHGCLRIGKLYYSEVVRDRIDEYLSWDNSMSAKTAEEISLADWQQWEETLVEYFERELWR